MAQYQNGVTPTFTSNELDHFVVKTLLENGDSTVCLNNGLDSVTMQKNNGHTALFTRFEIPAVDTNFAPEGQSKVPRQLVQTPYQVRIREYQEAFEVSRQAYELNPLMVVDAAKENLGPLIARTRERVRWNVVKAATNVLLDSSAHSMRSEVNSPVSTGRLRRLARFLRDNRGKYFTEMVSASTKIATEAVEPAFFAYCSTSLDSDLRNLPGFKVPSNYSDSNKKQMYEVGVFEDIRFFASPDFEAYEGLGGASSTMITTGGLCDVYPIVVCAKHYGKQLALQGEAKYGGQGTNLKANVLDKPDKSDIHNAKIVVASNWHDGILITNPVWIGVLEVACTAN
jgi:N4-gp56 family major capsid protein